MMGRKKDRRRCRWPIYRKGRLPGAKILLATFKGRTACDICKYGVKWVLRRYRYYTT